LQGGVVKWGRRTNQASLLGNTSLKARDWEGRLREEGGIGSICVLQHSGEQWDDKGRSCL